MSNKEELFLEWIKSRGAWFPSVELRLCLDGSGYGLFSKDLLRPNETFISLPRELMITAAAVAEMPKYREILRKANFTPLEALVLFFLLEDPRSSQFAPYLNILPKTFKTAMLTYPELNPDHLPELERTLWQKQQHDFVTMREKICKAVSDSLVGLVRERFVWAWHVVNTRCIFVENRPHPLIDNTNGDTVAVVPFVDMLNHSPLQSQAFAYWDSVLKSYRVSATRTIVADEQIYVCYGGHTNGQLWIEYGFTVADNPYNKVAMSREKMMALAEGVGIAVTDAHRRTIEMAKLPCTLYASDGAPSFGFKASMRILQLDAAEIRRYYDTMFDDSTEASDVPINEALKNLRKEFRAKLKEVDPGLRWLWEEQIAVVTECLQDNA